MRLEHVNLTVSNLDRSIAFYCDLLEISVRWKGPIDKDRLGAHVGNEDHYLALFQGTAEGKPKYDYRRPGVNHFGFVVDDLDATRQRAIDLGATVHLEADYEPGRRFYIFDPDGHEIELVEYR